jgi:hypothetical protein
LLYVYNHHHLPNHDILTIP